MIPYGVGDMVVCIYDGEWVSNTGLMTEITPVKGCVYTVREMFQNCWGGMYIRLVEIVNSPPDKEHSEAGFHADLFRPVRKTSIESLEKICLTAPAKKVLEV